MKADERLLQALVNCSAALAHIFGTEGERPVSTWAWRLGSRSMQYAGLGIVIAIPLWAAANVFVLSPFILYWLGAWAGCWVCQLLLVLRRWHGAFKRARQGG